MACFPSGRRLQELVGIENSLKAQKIALSYFSNENLVFKTPKTIISKLIKKSYPIGVLNYDDVQSMLDIWHKRLSSKENITINYKTEFLDFKKNENDRFEISYIDKNDPSVNIIESDFLVIANGRKGFQWLNKNIDLHENKAGLCFESERWKVCS